MSKAVAANFWWEMEESKQGLPHELWRIKKWLADGAEREHGFRMQSRPYCVCAGDVWRVELLLRRRGIATSHGESMLPRG